MANSDKTKARKNDWEKTKESADFLIIFKAYGIEILNEGDNPNLEKNRRKFKRSKKDENQLRGKCPFFCDINTEERRGKDDFSIHIGDKEFQNFDKTCQCGMNYKINKPLPCKGDIIGFVAFKEKIALSTAEKRVKEIMQGQGGVSKLTSFQEAEVKANNGFYKEEKPLLENKYVGKAPLELSQDEAELQKNGVTLDIAKVFGIGISKGNSQLKGRLAIPIRNSLGELMGYVAKGDKQINENDDEWVYPSPKFFNPSLELHGVFEAGSLYKTIAFPRIFVGYDLLKVSEFIYKHKLLALGIVGNSISGTQIRAVNVFELYLKERFKEIPSFNKLPISEIFVLSDENEDRRQELVNTFLSNGFTVRCPPPK